MLTAFVQTAHTQHTPTLKSSICDDLPFQHHYIIIVLSVTDDRPNQLLMYNYSASIAQRNTPQLHMSQPILTIRPLSSSTPNKINACTLCSGHTLNAVRLLLLLSYNMVDMRFSAHATMQISFINATFRCEESQRARERESRRRPTVMCNGYNVSLTTDAPHDHTIQFSTCNHVACLHDTILNKIDLKNVNV